MTSERIKQIQETTAYPDSLSVKQALLQVWNECEQEKPKEYPCPNCQGNGCTVCNGYGTLTN